MTLYTYGQSSSGNARPDLAPIAGRYRGGKIADGRGTPGWGALALCGIVEVDGHGRLTYDARQFEFTEGEDDGIRGVNDEHAPTEPSAQYNDFLINPERRGRAAKWSETDPQVRIRELQMGVTGVEAWQMNRSSNACLYLLDNLLFGASTVAGATLASTANAYWAGWDGSDADIPAAADVSATGDQWSSASGDIDADLTGALINYETATNKNDLDTLVCSARTKLYMQANTGLRLGTNVAATEGHMSEEMLLGALGGYGIRYLIVTPTGFPITDSVYLTKAGAVAGRDAMTEFVGSVLCWGRLSGQAHDSMGFTHETWTVEDGQIHKAYVTHYSDTALPYEGGVRITDVY